MNEDRDIRDPDAGSMTERATSAGEGATGDVWARAAEQALRDMARSQRHAAARQERPPKSGFSYAASAVRRLVLSASLTVASRQRPPRPPTGRHVVGHGSLRSP